MPVSNRKVVMITGAAGNLGVSVARAFLRAGASVVLFDRSPERLSKLYPEIVGSVDHLLAHSVDLTEAHAVEGRVSEALERFGRIDVLVNTVGGFRAGKSLEETPLEDWDFLFNLNARSLFIACRAVIPIMRRQGSGRIINVASRAALAGEANASLYSASKTVALRLTESMAAELRGAGVTANCILPGLIDTPQNRQAMPGGNFKSWVSPESLAEVALFLASEAAQDISGAAVPVFGTS